MIRKFFFLVLLISPLSIVAQTYYGQVCADDGEKLPGVSIVLQTSGGGVVAFTRSHTDGSFKLAVPEGKHADSISFSMIGFRKNVLDIRKYKNGQTVKMTEETTTIREVVIRPDRIRAEGDTLNYLVSVFRQKQDRSIADVIDKMPGLSVKADGSIEYQGQKINRFYVEGADLMGGQYAQISENLSPDKIKTVQVLENHQPIKVLKGVEFSQQAAINLVLKDDAKSLWSGIADIGTGATIQETATWLRDVKLMEMIFGRKIQSLSMYKTNNTGKDIQREVQDLTAFGEGAPVENGILRNISLGAPSIDAQRSRFNNTQILATNWLMKLKNADDLRIQISWLYDKARHEQTRETVYLDADSVIVANHTWADNYRNEWKAELNYKSNQTNYYLENQLRAYIDFNSSNGRSLLNNVPFQQKVIPRKRYIIDNYKMIRKKGNNSYSLATDFSYTYLPGRLLLTNQRMQPINLSQLYSNSYGYYEHSWGKFHLTGKAGAKIRIQSLEQDVKDKYTELTLYTEPTISFSSAAWRVNLSTPLSNIHRKYQGRWQSKLVLEPHFFASCQFTANWQASLSYHYSWAPADLKVISPMPIYLNQTTIIQGTGDIYESMTHQLTASLSHRNAATGLFSNINFSYLSHLQDIIYQSTMQETVYVRTPTDYTGSSHVTTLYGNLGKSFVSPNLSVMLSASYSTADFTLLLAGSPTKQRNRNGSVRLTLSFRPSTLCSLEGTSTLSYSQYVNVAAYQSFSHQIKLYLTPGNWQLGSINSFYHSNDHSLSSVFFSDLHLSYHTNTLEVALECANILGTNTFERKYMTNNLLLSSHNELRPRELISRITFNF